MGVRYDGSCKGNSNLTTELDRNREHSSTIASTPTKPPLTVNDHDPTSTVLRNHGLGGRPLNEGWWRANGKVSEGVKRSDNILRVWGRCTDPKW